jgi:excisionase family DNA binding protein
MYETAERERALLKTREVAELLNVHPRTVRRLVASGDLPGVQLEGGGLSSASRASRARFRSR